MYGMGYCKVFYFIVCMYVRRTRDAKGMENESGEGEEAMVERTWREEALWDGRVG